MNVIVLIDGRQAIPVRAIPFVVPDGLLDPEQLVAVLSGEVDGWTRPFGGLTAFDRSSGHTLPVHVDTWEPPLRALRSLRRKAEIATDDEDERYLMMRCQSPACFPAGTFVWRDEFEPRYLSMTSEDGSEGGVWVPDDSTEEGQWMDQDKLARRRILNLRPVVSADLRQTIEEGFESEFEAQQASWEHHAYQWATLRADQERVEAEKSLLSQLRASSVEEHFKRESAVEALESKLQAIQGRLDWLRSVLDPEAARAAEAHFQITKMQAERSGDLRRSDPTALATSIKEVSHSIDVEMALDGADCGATDRTESDDAPPVDSPAASTAFRWANVVPPNTPSPSNDDSGWLLIRPASRAGPVTWAMYEHLEKIRSANGARPTFDQLISAWKTSRPAQIKLITNEAIHAITDGGKSEVVERENAREAYKYMVGQKKKKGSTKAGGT